MREHRPRQLIALHHQPQHNWSPLPLHNTAPGPASVSRGARGAGRSQAHQRRGSGMLGVWIFVFDCLLARIALALAAV